MIDIHVFYQALPYLLRGIRATLAIAALSCSMGLTLGTILGLVQTQLPGIGSTLVTLYVTIIRGTPMLIQIAFLYFVLPTLGISLPAFWTAVLAIGFNSSAYVSQIIRTGIKAVNRGQIEAGKVLGLSRTQIIYYIVMPQAVRMVLPALGNEFITLIKDSSLASTIGVMELTKEGSLIKNQTYDALTVYCAVALCYLVLTTSLSTLINYIEQRMNRHVTH